MEKRIFASQICVMTQKFKAKRLYIQSAYALPSKDKVDQEQDSLLHIADGFRKIIIAGDRFLSGYNEEGILMVSLYDFLLGKIDLWK